MVSLNWQGELRCEIALDGYEFQVDNYEPPAYGRSISHLDAPTSNGTALFTQRSITDHGSLPGIWRPFNIHCVNQRYIDPVARPWGGWGDYMRLREIFNQLGVIHVLEERATGVTYPVVFGADGLTPKFWAKPNSRDELGNDLGPELLVTVSFLEMPVNIP